MKSILVATLGTRDLMFQVTNGDWYNIGDDRMKGDILGEQIEVVSDLALTEKSSFREISQYLWENIEYYGDRVKPVILGKLLEDKINDLEKVYLVVTDQNETVKEREKDTLYSGELIKYWLNKLNSDLVVNILYIGKNNENPSNFEEMFRWWQQVWKENIKPQPNQPILLCLKGGVGQASEASRISGLSFYGNDIKFYEFIPTPYNNQKGISSDYTGPFLGTNYLWDRTRQQALQLLKRYDYAGLENLVKPYYEQNKQKWKETYALIKSGLSWNQGQFEDFFQSASFSFNNQQKEQHQQYWWMAYEQAYTAVVRVKQKNTTEAMLHSFRAVEGLIYECLKHEFKDYMVNSEYTYSSLKSSVLNKYPALKELFVNNGNPVSDIKLDSRTQQTLIEKYIALTSPQANFTDLKAWGSEELRNLRNRLSHKLGGISEKELYQAWGNNIHNQQDWEKRILNCLNLITENKFSFLWQGSLFASIHQRVLTAIKNYNVV
ncbi:hypothetical protein [Microcystis aeruginosa]|uniref:hypothetical protein n=1 Tax=Microcystis aeruginosa TaxID=1126 RepID=UPI0018826F02|nr:hypothetical protein [Microcystis aeruginosa]MBE8993931.1 hypothetical protein [Microcystis aeruginosa LEGE 91341]